MCGIVSAPFKSFLFTVVFSKSTGRINTVAAILYAEYKIVLPNLVCVVAGDNVYCVWSSSENLRAMRAMPRMCPHIPRLP